MNILYINHYAGSTHHGMEFRPFYLASEWVKAGHRVRIVAANYSHLRAVNPTTNGVYQDEMINGIRYTWCKTPSYTGNGIGRLCNIFVFLYRLMRLKRWINGSDEAFDIVIASSTYPLDIFPARYIARKTNAKLIYEVHDLWPLTLIEVGGMSRYHPFVILLQIAENYAYRHADKVISMLPHAKAYMLQHGMADNKYEVIPNGVHIATWGATAGDGTTIDWVALRAKHRFLLGYLGGHGLSNALDDFIEAIALIKDMSLGVVLIGEGNQKKSLVKRANTLGLNNVYFFQAVPKSVVPSVLKQLDALYLGWKNQPIYRFGINPNKLFDYMMSAKPVLHACASEHDIVQKAHCGLSVMAENPQAIAQGILQISTLSLSQREKLGQAGQRYVLKHHDYRKLAKQFLLACSVWLKATNGMKLFDLIRSSAFLSINRFVVQAGSIVILSILGHYNAHLLASYTILFSTLSIFFVLMMSGQGGLRTEFARLKTKKKEAMALLASSLALFFFLSLAIVLIILSIGSGSLIRGEGVIFDAARHGLSWFILSIPLMAANNIIASFMEAHGFAKTVSKNRIYAVAGEIVCIGLFAILSVLSLLKIVLVYVLLDLISLIALIHFCRKNNLCCFSGLKISSIQPLVKLLKIGLPSIFSQASTTYVTFILVTTMAVYGTASVVALSMVNSFVLLIKIPAVGVIQQMGLEVAERHSQQKPIGDGMKTALGVIAFIACVGSLILLFGSHLLGSVLTDDTASRTLFSQSIGWVIIYFISSVFSMVLGSLFYAMGEYVIHQMVIPLCMVIGFLPYLLVANDTHSFSAIFSSYVLFGCLADVVLLVWYIRVYRSTVTQPKTAWVIASIFIKNSKLTEQQ